MTNISNFINNNIWLKTSLLVLIPFLVVVILIPHIKKIAIKINAVDVARKEKGNRHVHKKDTPKLGGLGIFIGFLVGYMIFGEPSVIMNSVLIGSFIILLIGIIDDIHELSSKTQLIAQIFAASVVVFYGGLLIDNISAFGLNLDFGILAYPFTLFFIIGAINCINLIDGLDGLSGGISAIYFLTIGIIAIIQGKFGLDYVLTFVMFGSVLGFLVYNFNPATIFAGNSGAFFMGFIISVIALLGFKNVTLTSLAAPLFVLAIPILDTSFAIIRRKLKGQNVMQADRGHVHHQFLNRNVSVRKTVIIIYVIDILFALASIVYVLDEKNTISYTVYTTLLVLVIGFVMKTNIIFDHEEVRKFLKKLRKKN